MPTTPGPQLRSAADVILNLTNCSRTEANAAEKLLCKNRGRLEKFAVVCGISTAAIGFGGRLMLTGAAAPEGAVIAITGVFAAKKYCKALVNEANTILEQASLEIQ